MLTPRGWKLTPRAAHKQVKAAASNIVQKFKFLAGSSRQTNQTTDRQNTGPNYLLIGRRQQQQTRPRISAILELFGPNNML